MAVITRPFTYTSGQTIAPAQNTSNETTIYNEFNGNIDATNFKADISASKGAAQIVGTADAYSYQIKTNTVVGVELQSAGNLLLTPSARSGTPGTTGSILNLAANTFTDNNTVGSGTAAAWVGTAIQRPTLAASNTLVTTTDAASVYVANAPLAGTNQTLTNAWAAWFGGAIRVDGTIVQRIGGFKGIRTHANTADRTYTWPDKSGTTAMTSDVVVGVQKAGVAVGSRPNVNLIEGSNVTLTVADNPGSSRVDVTVAAAGGSALAGSQVVKSDGDFTTTSASYVAITGLSITITTGARACLVTAWMNAGTGTNGQFGVISLYLDAANYANNLGVRTNGVGNIDNWAMALRTSVLSAASHTFALYGLVSGGGATLTVYANATANQGPATFGVTEVY